jgi:hypothetical protein
MTSLLDQINRLQSSNKEKLAEVESVEDELKREYAQSQSWAARLIISAFIVCIVAIFLMVIIYFGLGKDWKKPADFLLTVVSSVLLPVVTLVLGYYFGSEEKKKGK